MRKRLGSSRESTLNMTSRMSFTVAACALLAAVAGAIVNHWIAGWMAVGGMLAVSLFYFLIGLHGMISPDAAPDDPAQPSSSEQRASADNLYSVKVTEDAGASAQSAAASESVQISADRPPG